MSREASRHQLQELHRLTKESRYREACGYVVLQGSNMIWEWLEAGKEVVALFKTTQAPCFTPNDYNAPAQMLSQAAGLDTTAEIYHVAVVKKPEFVKPKASLDTLIIDGLQDPGNIGTLMRSARAFGFEQMVLIEPCCDPYNEKVIRSSQGACVYLNLWKTSLESIENLLEEESIIPWVAHSKNEHSVNLESFTKEAKKGPIWLVIGSEGKGPRPELLKRGKNLHLPMQECVESLNAAVAGSILTSYVFQAKLVKGSSL